MKAKFRIKTFIQIKNSNKWITNLLIFFLSSQKTIFHFFFISSITHVRTSQMYKKLIYFSLMFAYVCNKLITCKSKGQRRRVQLSIAIKNLVLWLALHLLLAYQRPGFIILLLIESVFVRLTVYCLCYKIWSVQYTRKMCKHIKNIPNEISNVYPNKNILEAVLNWFKIEVILLFVLKFILTIITVFL